MIPILFDANEKRFTTQGIGSLVDVISCKVEEERNGIYELEMEYPITGTHFENIQKRNIIYAIPSPYRTPQPFRIYKITKPLSGIITIYAAHITYDLNGIPINSFEASNLVTALSGIKNNAAIQNDFDYWTDKSSVIGWELSVPTAARSCLGGVKGSILDTYGGEYEWDKFLIKLHNQRGIKRGVGIRYRKNLTDLNQEEDIENTVTGIYPYWKDNEGNLVTCNPPIIYAEGNFDYQKAVPVDFSNDFEEKPSVTQLTNAAKSYIDRNEIGKPKVSMKVSFLQLEQMTGYEDLKLLERCDLCDTVTVEYEELGINVSAKIVKITTNVLTERYDQMELGSIRANIAQTIVDQNKDLNDQSEKLTDYQKWLYEQQKQINSLPTNSQLQDAVDNATQLITGNQGGYIVMRLNDIGQPYEMLIMDTMSIDTAINVWRFNKNGWGYSKRGYNGPYTMAATVDGGIVANFITAGTMLFNRLKGGTMQLGGAGNGNGVQEVRSEAGNVIGTWDHNGINVIYGELKIGKNFSVDLAGSLKAFVPRFYAAIQLSETTALGEGTAKTVMQLMTDKMLFVGSGDMDIRTNQSAWLSDTTVSGEFVVIGTKSNAVKTKNYGTRLLYSIEGPRPMYFDSGEGTTDENGECCVMIEELFQNAAHTKGSYQIFLTGKSEGNFYIKEQTEHYFMVCGPAKKDFFWEIKARQKADKEKRFERFGEIEKYRPKYDEMAFSREAEEKRRETGEHDYLIIDDFYKRKNYETPYIDEIKKEKKRIKKVKEELQ